VRLVRGGGELADLLVLWMIAKCQYAKRPIFKQKMLAFLFGRNGLFQQRFCL
jgi:hypothetical protein